MNTTNLSNRIEKRYDEVEKKSNGDTHEFFFKDKKGNLLGYIKINKGEIGDNEIIYINETTSSASFNLFKDYSQNLVDLYNNNGYNPKVSLKDFGKDMYLYILDFIIEKYPNTKIIHAVALDKIENIQSITRIIGKIKDLVNDTIKEVTPSGTTIYLK